MFQKYGRLAQISLKAAYGFVQFHSSDDCRRAMHEEQGANLGDRKLSMLLRLAVGFE